MSKLLNHGAKGESSALSLLQLKALSSQWHWAVLRPVKRQQQSLVFSYWNVRGQGLGREEPTWKHSCANRSTDLCNVPRCAFAFSWLSHISFVPATQCRVGPGALLGLSLVLAPDTSLPSYLASLLHLFSIASVTVSQIYYLGIQTVPLHTYVNSKLPHR